MFATVILTHIEDYMLPCLNKKMFGVDCPGCGIQRAIALIFKGEFVAALKMYPAIYTLILLFVFLGIDNFVKIKHSSKITLALIFLNLGIIIINFIQKLIH